MIWLSPICSSLLLVSTATAATVIGTVELTGSQIPAVSRQKNYSGVVVWLESTNGPVAPVPRHVEMVQKDKTFRPHVLAIPGTGDPGHLVENVAAGALRLTDEELRRLDGLHRAEG